VLDEADYIPQFTAIYDVRNLPTSITHATGGSAVYRYNGAGQRIYKNVNGTVEHYVMNGSATLAVLNANGSLKYWVTPFGRAEKVGSFYIAYYYLKDHLGSTRVVMKEDGTRVEGIDYDPWGVILGGRNYQNGSLTKERFTGKERDAESGLDYFGARYYHPGLGRFLTTDRFAHKYPNMTPYQYAANNPLKFIDVNGDSLNVAGLNTVNRFNLLNNWEDITGLRLGVNENGNVIVLDNTTIKEKITLGNGSVITTEMRYVTGNKDGKHSIIAKDFLETSIGLANRVTITNGNNGSKASSSTIWLDMKQIDRFVSGTPRELNNKTLGLGMVSLHELYHTIAGAFFENGKNYIGMQLQGDTKLDGVKGPTVEFMNRIRSELGTDYGQRSQYLAQPNGIPFQVSQGAISVHVYIHL